MKYIVIVLLMFPSLLFALPHQDKLLHATVSVTMHMGCAAIVKSITKKKLVSNIACAAGTLAVGAAKEVWDSRGHGDSDPKDIAAGMAGTLFSFSIFQLSF